MQLQDDVARHSLSLRAHGSNASDGHATSEHELRPNAQAVSATSPALPLETGSRRPAQLISPLPRLAGAISRILTAMIVVAGCYGHTPAVATGNNLLRMRACMTMCMQGHQTVGGGAAQQAAAAHPLQRLPAHLPPAGAPHRIQGINLQSSGMLACSSYSQLTDQGVTLSAEFRIH